MFMPNVVPGLTASHFRRWAGIFKPNSVRSHRPETSRLPSVQGVGILVALGRGRMERVLGAGRNVLRHVRRERLRLGRGDRLVLRRFVGRIRLGRVVDLHGLLFLAEPFVEKRVRLAGIGIDGIGRVRLLPWPLALPGLTTFFCSTISGFCGQSSRAVATATPLPGWGSALVLGGSRSGGRSAMRGSGSWRSPESPM